MLGLLLDDHLEIGGDQLELLAQQFLLGLLEHGRKYDYIRKTKFI